MPVLDERLQAVLDDFALLDGWNARYEYLIALGNELPAFPENLRGESTAVQGCLSPVWLTGQIDSAGLIALQGDSEGILPRGLVGLCVKLFSGTMAAEISRWNRDLATELGLTDNLSPTRAKAFGNLLTRVRELAGQVPSLQFKKGKTSGDYFDRFGGLERLYGDGCLEKLRTATVAVIGLGGVGTWAAEALARSGVGHLVLIDRDDICITNTNRQLHALEGDYGRFKVEAMADRLMKINPELKIRVEKVFLTRNNVAELLTPLPTAVIDAMDSVPDKAALADFCLGKRLPMLVSGGAGGKADPTRIRRADLAKAHGDPLLKAFKRRLKTEFNRDPGQNQPYNLECIYSEEPAVFPWQVCAASQAPQGGSKIGCETGFGSVTQVTGAFGFALAGRCVQILVKLEFD